MLNALITIDVKLVFNVLLIVIDLDDALDFEHTDQQVLKKPYFDVLLDDDEQLVLQLDDGLVDLVDRRYDVEHDCPPLGRRRLEVRMGVRVLDDLASTQKLVCVVKVHTLVCFLWAHLAVHIHDELLLVMQVHAPLVDDLNLLPISR